MKKFILFFLILSMAGFIAATKPVKMTDLIRPGSIVIDKDDIYIPDGASILIYSKKDFSLKKKFGRTGQGPGEFEVMLNFNRGAVGVKVFPDYLFVNSLSKISFFTKDGQVKNEMKINNILSQFVPIKDKFAGLSYINERKVDYIALKLYDKELKNPKIIFKMEANFAPGKPLNPVIITRFPRLYACNDKLYINSEDGIIHVFDASGKELAPLKYDYEKIELTDERKKQYDEFFLADVRFKMVYNRDKQLNRIKFPDYVPLIKDYLIAGKKIYVITSKENQGKWETFVFNLEGKLEKKLQLPLVEANPTELYPFTVSEGKIYQLVDNEETESWELHIHTI